MINILIFRTDRIGDLIITCPVIITLKKYFKNSKITLIASKKNYTYAKSLNIFDEIFYLPKGVINKIKFIKAISKKRFNYVFIYDGKERSILLSALIKSDYKVALLQKKFFLYSFLKIKFFKDSEKTNLNTIFQEMLNYCQIKVIISNYNFLVNKTDNKFSLNLPIKKYLHIHLDEKWFNDLYIKSYTNIKPNYNEFVNFLNTMSTSNNVLITSGLVNFKLIDDLKNKYFNKLYQNIYNIKKSQNSVYLVFMPTFEDLESLLRNTKILVSCHGAITHAANSFCIKKIDIIEYKQEAFYKRFTSYLEDYHYVYRENFNKLSSKILDLLKV